MNNYGVRCPACHGKRSRVLEAREGPGYVRRRHLCLSPVCLLFERCVGARLVKGLRWTTYEFVSLRRGTITVPHNIRGYVPRENTTGSVRTLNS